MAATMIPPTPSFSIRRPVQQQKKMSITQTYYLAHTARGKLSKEADRADHDLRLLVGHANLLDALMLDLANAEKEQEHWFNQTVRSAAKSTREDRHIQWADAVIEEDEEEDFSDSDSSSDSDSDYFEEEEEEEHELPVRRAPASITVITEHEVSDEDEDADDTDRLTLTRSPSRQSPPELLDDLSSDSDEDSMPPSPESVTMNTFGASGKEPSVSTVAMFHPVKRAAMPFADSDQPQIVQEGHNYSTMIPAY
jgi:hypothetical protein